MTTLKREHSYPGLTGPAEASSGRGRHSFPALAPQVLSDYAKSNNGRGWCIFPGLATQGLFSPREISHGRWGTASPAWHSRACLTLGGQPRDRGGLVWVPWARSEPGRSAMEDDIHFPWPDTPHSCLYPGSQPWKRVHNIHGLSSLGKASHGRGSHSFPGLSSQVICRWRLLIHLPATQT